MEKKKTILIFGMSSYVGSNLANELKKKYRVVGTYYSRQINIPGTLAIHCDILSRDMVQMVIFMFKPDITIYCVGLNSIESCHKHEKLAEILNSSGLYNVSNFSERYRAKLIYFSSHYVFAGENKLYSERDTPLPNTIFGRTKVSAEFFIQKSSLNYVIFRCCNLIGRSYNPLQLTFLEALQRKMHRQETCDCDGRVRMGFLPISFIFELVEKVIQQDITNRLFQVCSRDIMSYFDLAKLYCKVFSVNESLIMKKDWSFPEEITNMSEYNADQNLYYHMDCFNLQSFILREAPSIEEGLVQTFLSFGGKKGKSKMVKKSTGVTYI